jgi:hypothetical protein
LKKHGELAGGSRAALTALLLGCIYPVPPAPYNLFRGP